MVVDASNWGISKALVSMCNIGDDDMEETIFERTQLLFNRYRGMNKLFDKKVKRPADITNAMDRKLISLAGEDTGYRFSSMHICGMMNENPAYEAGWNSVKQYSDSAEGNAEYVALLKNILLHT